MSTAVRLLGVSALTAMSVLVPVSAQSVTPGELKASRSLSSQETVRGGVVVTGPSRVCGAGGVNALVPQGWGRADFTRACANHDACYAQGSKTSRHLCDLYFVAEMHWKCANVYPPTGRWLDRNLWIRNTCKSMAHSYYLTVRTMGIAFYRGGANPL